MESKDELKEIDIKLHTKLQLGQNHCALGSIKQMDLLKFIMELDIHYYLIMGGLIKFVTGLNIL